MVLDEMAYKRALAEEILRSHKFSLSRSKKLALVQLVLHLIFSFSFRSLCLFHMFDVIIFI